MIRTRRFSGPDRDLYSSASKIACIFLRITGLNERLCRTSRLMRMVLRSTLSRDARAEVRGSELIYAKRSGAPLR